MAYYRAKTLQEDLVKAGPIPYSIVRATQFMEFIAPRWTGRRTATWCACRHPDPAISSAEVAAAVAETAAGAPAAGTLDIGGPEVFTLDELGSVTLAATGDHRHVVTDDTAGLFALVKGDALLAPAGAQLASTHYRDWLRGVDGRLRSGQEPAGSTRIHRSARAEAGVAPRAVRRHLGPIRVEPPALARVRDHRVPARGDQEADSRTPRAGDPFDEAEYEMYPPVLKSRTASTAPTSASSATAHSASPARTSRRASGPRPTTGRLRRAGRPVLLHRPRPGPAPVV